MSSKYRIKINLEEFFQNEKKFSYILIKSDWKHVKDVKDHIKKIFSLKNISLLIEDVYLPASESIGVINHNDEIKVVRKNWRKTENVFCDSIISKGVTSENKGLPNGVMSNHDNKLKSKQICNSTEIPNNQKLDELDEHENALSENEEERTEVFVTTRRKRKRKRKCEGKINEQDYSSTPKKKLAAIIENKKLNPFPLTKNRNHLKFDNDGNMILENGVDSSEKKSDCKIIFKNYLDDLPLVPRIITPIGSNSTVDDPNDNENQSDNLDSNNFGVNSSDKIKIETIQNTAFDINSVSCSGNSVENSINVNECLKFSVPLNTLPIIGDILIFKIYQLNDKCEPCLSNYICGKVENIENDTNLIKLLIIEGQNQLKSVDHLSYNGTDTFVHIKLDDMIDKNVFKI